MSGFSKEVTNPYELFVARLKELEPEAYEAALPKFERLVKGNKGKWEELTKGAAALGEGADEGVANSAGGGFAFGFGGDDDDDDVEVP